MPVVSAPRRLLTGALLPLIVAGALGGCLDEVRWSSRERANARLLARSLELTASATRLAADLDPRTASTEQRREVANLLRGALTAALQVNDLVLQKAHDDLPKRWRQDYLRALQQLVVYYGDGEHWRGDNPGRRLNAFLRWYAASQPEFRWWRGGPSA